MRDLAREVFESVRRNKMRTALAGFSVSWGIFMLIVLLGAGNGLMNAFTASQSGIMTNTMMIGAGRTSKAWDGLSAGRRIQMGEKDLALLSSPAFAEYLDQVTATLDQSDLKMSVDGNSVSVNVSGVYPEYKDMDYIEMVAGRFINQNDFKTRRKVLVISTQDVRNLFSPGMSAEAVIGKRVKLGQFSYRIVGVKKADKMMMGSTVYMPFTTMQTIYRKGSEYSDLTFSFHGLETEEENEQFEKRIKTALNTINRAAPDDESSFWIWNRFTQEMQRNKATGILNTALWIVGIFTLLSGIVGISNIMLITVKERTHEFGIRKAIGASPGAIASLIIFESVAITSLFGYIGMFIAMVLCYSLEGLLSRISTFQLMGESVSLLVNPTVGLNVALEATVLLVIAGTIAGLSPALKAVRVRPIEALNAR